MVLGDALRHGPDDDAAGVLGQQLGDHLPELGALLPALDLAAHADLRGVRHVDEETSGEGDLRGDPAPLGADRLLGHLDREVLTLLEDVLDVRATRGGGRSRAGGSRLPSPDRPGRRCHGRARRRSRPRQSGFAFRAPLLQGDDGWVGSLASFSVRLVFGLVGGVLVLIGLEQVGGVEEGALFLTDVHEGGLNARQHRLDPAEVDVADGPPVVGAIHQQLHQPVVLEDGHAGLPLAPVDQDLALQAVRPRRGRRSCTPHPGSQLVRIRLCDSKGTHARGRPMPQPGSCRCRAKTRCCWQESIYGMGAVR